MSPETRREWKRQYQVRWRLKHPGYFKAWAQQHYGPHRPRYLHYARKGALKAKYGITIEDYDRLLAAQGGVCAICDRPPLKYRLAVDHNHATGAIRKLLCGRCNRKLGTIEDANFKAKAEAYLKEHDS